jgi:hypothetical protein
MTVNCTRRKIDIVFNHSAPSSEPRSAVV